MPGDSIGVLPSSATGFVPVAGTLVGDDFVQDVNVTAAALPTGAATQTTLAAVLAALASLQAVLEATLAVAGPLTDAELRATPLPVAGTVTSNAGTGTRTTKEVRAATATLTNVAASVTSVTVLAANADRLGATVWNDSTSILYLKFGSTASATSCTVKLVADAYYEVPALYTGILTGIWVAAVGSARVSEMAA